MNCTLQGVGGTVVLVGVGDPTAVLVGWATVDVAVEGTPVAVVVCVDTTVMLGPTVIVGFTVLVACTVEVKVGLTVFVDVGCTVGVPRQPLSTVITPVMLGW